MRKFYPALFVFAPLLYACSGTALQVHARSATVVGSALSVARVGIRDSRVTAMREVELQSVGSPDDVRLEAMDRVAERFAPAVVSYNVVQLALDAWVNTLLILAADQAGDNIEEELLSAAAGLLRAWSPMVGALRPLGVEVPDLPAPLMSLFSEEGAE